jgi:hypothetical protein
MKMLVTILCCGTLMLGPAVAGAKELFDSKEILPNLESAPAGPSQGSSSSSQPPKAGLPRDTRLTNGVVSVLGAVPGIPPALSEVLSTVPATGGPAVPGVSSSVSSAQQKVAIPNEMPPEPSSPTGTPLPGAVEQSRAIRTSKQKITTTKPSASAPVLPPDKPVAPGLGDREKPTQEQRSLPAEEKALTSEPLSTLKEKNPEIGSPKEAGSMRQEPRPVLNQNDSKDLTEPDSSPCGATSSAGLLYQRFCMQEHQKALIETDDLDWGDPDCGCTPWLKSFTTYGLYPLWAKNEEGPVNFERWTRVGYFALTPDKEGHIHPPRQWTDKWGDRKQADRIPQRFGTALDLVISNNRWAVEEGAAEGLALTKSYVMFGLVDNVVEAVKTYGFNGVTIDFDFATLRGNNEVFHDYKHAYIAFIRNLRKALQGEQEGYGLHVTLGYYPGLTDQVFAKSEVEELADSVDLILFMPNQSPNNEKKQRGMERYDDYFKGFSYGDLSRIEKKVVFIFQSSSMALNLEMEDVNSNRFGGVGIWAPNQRSEKAIVLHVHDDIGVQGTDIVERTLQSAPSGSFCKLVCPNRTIIGTLMLTGVVVYVGGYLLWAFLPGVWLRRMIKAYRLYVFAGALILFLMFLSLGYCVPVRWPGLQGAVFLALLGLLGLWILKKYMDKKREATYP